MSVSLFEPVDLTAAAARGARLNETHSLSRLTRFVEAAPASAERTLTTDLRLRLGEDGLPRVRGHLRGEWVRTCQRGLGELASGFDLPVDWRFAPDDEDGFELSDDAQRLADFVEDELLLALPAVPMHEDPADCDAQVSAYLATPEAESGAAPVADAVEMRTPFAGLKDLLRDPDG